MSPTDIVSNTIIASGYMLTNILSNWMTWLFSAPVVFGFMFYIYKKYKSSDFYLVKNLSDNSIRYLKGACADGSGNIMKMFSTQTIRIKYGIESEMFLRNNDGRKISEMNDSINLLEENGLINCENESEYSSTYTVTLKGHKINDKIK